MGGGTASDLVEALLAGAPDERPALLAAAPADDLAGAITLLGRRRDQEAAGLLALIGEAAADKDLRRAARRELHRLRSLGIAPPTPLVQPAADAPSEDAASPAASVAPSEAWTSFFDAGGSRMVWLVADRPLGGIWHVILVAHETRGLLETEVADSTRKRFRREIEALRIGAHGSIVDLPPAYALALVREAVDLTRTHGGSLPAGYRQVVDLFGEAPAGPERALVYETISPMDARLHPEWLDESPGLMMEPEVAVWGLAPSPALRARTLALARSAASPLLVPGLTPEEQAARLLDEAARELLQPAARQALTRRLEETAYLFVRSDRLPSARWAVATAQAIADPARPPVPWLDLLVAASLLRAVGSEPVAPGARAADILLPLFEAAAAEARVEAPAPSVSPSGLILPGR